MIESHQFPFCLQSYQGQEPQHQSIQFLNYYPKTVSLQANVKKINSNIQQIQATHKQKMFNIVQQFMNNQQGVINIYPKKNTIDLKKHLERKMKNINKKTDKAIVYFAKQKLKKAHPEAQINSSDDD